MSIASEITRLQNAKANLKTAINTKTDAQHKITTETIDDYADFVDSISSGGKEIITWNQCPTLPNNFINNVTYNANDYSTTLIENYMSPSITPTAETKALYTHPIGTTVDGITYYNQVPNIETPFSSTNKAGVLKPLDRLRWIKGSSTLFNCRDLGGWACDGGTIKYGMFFRGNACTLADRNALVNECGIRRQLDLRGSDTAITESPLGTDIKYYRNPNYSWYSLEGTSMWHDNLAFAFESAKYNEPLYFHCSAGADRTGTFACIIEALLGVSQSDIDKDYELTCFSTGTNNADNARERNEANWSGAATQSTSGGLITQINALAKGTTFRDKVVNWVASLGFTENEINAFRHSMINGDPEDVHIIVIQYSITNTLTHTINNNASTVIDEDTAYNATLTAESGYEITSVNITMGGVDITSQAYSNGNISIASVTGNIVITATSTAPIVNLWDVNNAQLNKRWGSSTISTKDGAFITNPIYAIPGDVIYLKNYYNNNSVYKESDASIQKVVAVSSENSKVYAQLFNASFLNISGSVAYFTIPTSWTNTFDHIVLTLFSNTNSTKINASDVSNVVITKNQPLS